MSFKDWLKGFLRELLKPENIAKNLTLALFVLAFGTIFSFIFTYWATPHPDIVINCNDDGTNMIVEAVNEGNKAAYDLEIRVKTTHKCNFGMSTADASYNGREFHNVTSVSTSEDGFNMELRNGGKLLITGTRLGFYCPRNAKVEISIGGSNFGEKAKTCKPIE